MSNAAAPLLMSLIPLISAAVLIQASLIIAEHPNFFTPGTGDSR